MSDKKIKNCGIVYVALFIIISLLASSLPFEDILFTFSRENSRQKTFHDANQTIVAIKDLGYDTERLQDILDEAVIYEDDNDFFSIIDVFKNTTDGLNNLRKKAYSAGIDIEIIKKQNITVQNASLELAQAQSELIDGRYESAEILLNEISGEIGKKKSELTVSIDEKFNEFNFRLVNASGDETILSGLRAEIKSLDENNLNVQSMNIINDEIITLETSLFYIEQLKEFVSYAKDKKIDSTEITDGLDESYYLIKAGKYEKAAELLYSLQQIISEEKKAKKSIDDANKEIMALPESGEKQDMLREISEMDSYYMSGDFETAGEKAESIMKDVLYLKSELILSESIGKKGASLAEVIKKNIAAILIALAFITCVFLIFRGYIAKLIINKKVKYYEERKNRIFGIMKDLQEQYYVQRKISKRSYLKQMRQNELRYADITKDLVMMNKKVKR